MTGSGADTGAAARRGHDDLRRRHRQTYPGEAPAHRATAARPVTLTSVCSCLVDASAERTTAAKLTVLRAIEELGARSTGCPSPGMMPGLASDPQVAHGAQPGRPGADRLPDQPVGGGPDGRVHERKGAN